LKSETQEILLRPKLRPIDFDFRLLIEKDATFDFDITLWKI